MRGQSTTCCGLQTRADLPSFHLGLYRFIDEVLALAFTWNEQFVPAFKWRVTHFRRLPICPTAVSEELDTLLHCPAPAAALPLATAVVTTIKQLMQDLYHLDLPVTASLAAFAQAMHSSIADPEVKQLTCLEW